MGRPWRACQRSAEREWRQQGAEGSSGRLGERERRESAAEAWWRCVERDSRRRARRAGGSGSTAFCGTGPCRRANRASQEASLGPGGPRVVPSGTGGVGGPPPSVDLPRRGVAAVAAGGSGRVVVSGGGGAGGSFSVDVVAGRIRFLVWGGRSLLVGGVLGWSAWWVVLPSHALVLLVHGRLLRGEVGWWAVVAVVVVVVVVSVGALVAVALGVLVMVLRVCPQDPLVFRWGLGSGIVCSPWVRTAWWVLGAGSGPGLTATEVEESHVPGSVWPTAAVVSGGWMLGRLEMGMLTRACTRSCWVAASAVAPLAGGRGAWDAVPAGSGIGFWLGFGSGRGRFCCRRTLCDF